MSSTLKSLISSLSTAVHEVLLPDNIYRCQLDEIVVIHADKSQAQGVGFKWKIHYEKDGKHKTTMKTENFWLINREGEAGSEFTRVALRNRLLSFGVPLEKIDHFVWPWEAKEDGHHDGIALVNKKLWFNAVLKKQEDSEYLQLEIKDPRSIKKTKTVAPPIASEPKPHPISGVQAKEAWERKQEKIKKREREEKEKVKDQEEPFEYADSSESEVEPEPPKKKKGKKAAESETPAPPKTPNRNRKVKTEPVTSIPVVSPSLTNYDFPMPNSDFTFPPL